MFAKMQFLSLPPAPQKSRAGELRRLHTSYMPSCQHVSLFTGCKSCSFYSNYCYYSWITIFNSVDIPKLGTLGFQWQCTLKKVLFGNNFKLTEKLQIYYTKQLFTILPSSPIVNILAHLLSHLFFLHTFYFCLKLLRASWIYCGPLTRNTSMYFHRIKVFS